MKKKLITKKSLLKADIILSTTSDATSLAVKMGTFSAYSHARLVLDTNKVVEAVEPKVRKEVIDTAMKDDKYAAVYRMRIKLTKSQQDTIMNYAVAQIGKPYDLSGAIGSAKASRLVPGGLAAAIENGMDPEKEFYCSELISFAYNAAALKVSKRMLSQTTPEALASSDNLYYIGHLKL